MNRDYDFFMATHLSGRRVILISLCLVATVFLTAYASNDKKAGPALTAANPTSSPLILIQYAVPMSCIETKVLSVLRKTVPTAKFINTEWTPMKGAELADVLNNSGIACSFGIQPASVGITAMWVSDTKNLFDSRVSKWLEEGFVKVDVPQIEEEDAYFLHKPQSTTQEYNVWQLELKIHGFWTQLGITFGDTLESGLPLIQASVDSLNFIDQPSFDRSIT